MTKAFASSDVAAFNGSAGSEGFGCSAGVAVAACSADIDAFYGPRVGALSAAAGAVVGAATGTSASAVEEQEVTSGNATML